MMIFIKSLIVKMAHLNVKNALMPTAPGVGLIRRSEQLNTRVLLVKIVVNRILFCHIQFSTFTILFQVKKMSTGPSFAVDLGRE